MGILYFRINNFLETDSTIKINVKKQRRYYRSTAIFKLKDRIFIMLLSVINCKNANEIQTKTLKYLYQNNTRILRQE